MLEIIKDVVAIVAGLVGLAGAIYGFRRRYRAFKRKSNVETAVVNPTDVGAAVVNDHKPIEENAGCAEMVIGFIVMLIALGFLFYTLKDMKTHDIAPGRSFSVSPHPDFFNLPSGYKAKLSVSGGGVSYELDAYRKCFREFFTLHAEPDHTTAFLLKSCEGNPVVTVVEVGPDEEIGR